MGPFKCSPWPGEKFHARKPRGLILIGLNFGPSTLVLVDGPRWRGLVWLADVFAVEGLMTDREPANQSKHQPRPLRRPVAQIRVHPDQLKRPQNAGREAAH